MKLDNHISAWLDSAGSEELSLLVQAVVSRYHILFPDEEVIFLSLPTRDPEERAALLRHIQETLLHP